MRTAIGYVRVSTSAQGKSGLGLEAQQAALARFAEAEGYELLQTFTEVETGKGAVISIPNASQSLIGAARPV